MKGKNGILLLLLAALVLGPILWQITPRAMVTPEEVEQTAELQLGVGDLWLARELTLTDPEEIRELEQWNSEIAGGGRVGTHMFYGAPVVLVVLAKRYSTSVEDGSLILGNLMLAAHSLGLGSCWIHRAREEFDSPRGKELLKKWGVEGDYIGVGHCILGYPDGELPKAKDRTPDFAIWR